MPGLIYRKLDLHVHTPASKCYSSPDHSPEQIVQAAIDCGLSAIAVTDHNTAAWIDIMKKAAQDTGLIIFPGAEISLSEGFHLVALVGGQFGAIDVELIMDWGLWAVLIVNAHDVDGAGQIAHMVGVNQARARWVINSAQHATFLQENLVSQTVEDHG